MAIWSQTSISNLGRYTTQSADYYMPEYAAADARLKKVSDRTVPLKSLVNPDFPITYGVLKPREVEGSSCRLARIQNSESLFIFGGDLPPISDVQFDEYRRSEVRKGDIVIAIGGYIGPLGFVSNDEDVRININRHLARVSPEPGRIDPYYLAAYLASPISQKLLQREIRGAVQAGINIADLKLHPIFRPDESDQKEVGDLMRQSEQHLISARNTYTQAQERFETALGLDKVRFDKPKMCSGQFSVTELATAVGARRIDAQCFSPEAVYYEDWLLRSARCDRLGSLLSSMAKGRQQDPVEGGGFDYCSIKDISGREVVSATKTLPTAGTPTAIKNDLLLAITGATIGKIGILKRYDSLVFSGDLLRLRVNKEVSSHYLLLMLDHHIGHVQFSRWITGSTNGHLAPRDIVKVLVPRLAAEKENQISSLVSASLRERQASERLAERAKTCIEKLIEKAVKL